MRQNKSVVLMGALFIFLINMYFVHSQVLILTSNFRQALGKLLRIFTTR